jgi:hypothetical protein
MHMTPMQLKISRSLGLIFFCSLCLLVLLLLILLNIIPWDFFFKCQGWVSVMYIGPFPIISLSVIYWSFFYIELCYCLENLSTVKKRYQTPVLIWCSSVASFPCLACSLSKQEHTPSQKELSHDLIIWIHFLFFNNSFVCYADDSSQSVPVLQNLQKNH